MISSSQIKLIRSLSQKKFRDKNQLYIIEGEKLVKELEIGSVPYLALFYGGELLYSHNGLISKKELMIYGFNNPDPTPGQEEYGYEFYIPTDLNLEEDDTVKIKQMKGGTFAVTECHVIEDFEQIGRSWKELVAWVKEQSEYGFGECFWYEHHPIPLPGSEGFILNLYLPIVEK